MLLNIHIKFLILFTLGLCIFISASAQEPTFGQYGSIDRQVKKMSGSLSNNIIQVHRYLDSIGITDEEKIRAFYMWIIMNIEYKDQIELLFDKRILFYVGSNNCASPVCVFNKRQAVCEGFSKLFQFFCQQSGIEAYTIGGYISKRGQFQDKATHSWNVVKINNHWRFFDLTWAYASLVHTGIKKTTNEFFMIEPHEFILSHLPLIPVWQFLATPVPISIFNLGDEGINHYLETQNTYYNYSDSLNQYNRLDARMKCLYTIAKIHKTNRSNRFNRAIEYYKYGRIVLNSQSLNSDKSMDELLDAKEKILEAMHLFKETSDIASQLMFLQARDNIAVVQQWIQMLNDKNVQSEKTN